MKSISWPMVGFAFIITSGFVGIYYLSDTAGKNVLLPLVVGLGSAITTITTIIISRRFVELHTTLEQLKEHTNGNTMRLIDKIPNAERPAPQDIPQIP